jgi:hypothetical protein
LATQTPLKVSVDLAPPAPDLEIRPRQVKKWLESRPLNVTFETGRALCRHLAAVNRARVDLDARVQILEAYRPAATRILADLELMYAKASLPLGPGPRAALGLAREFLTELALGYRLALTSLGTGLFASKRQQAALLFQAMHHTAERMFAAYKSYTPVPTGTWAELHELYLRADEAGVARDAAGDDAKRTLADIYAEALLLSLTDPYRLGQGDAERVLHMVRSHRGMATLGRERPGTPSGGHFLVPCNTDKPPKPSIGKLDDPGGPDWRLLDANPLVQQLRALGPAADSRNTATKRPENARAELVAKLVRLWGDPPKRTSRRDAGQSTVAITMGLEGVGHFVALEPRMDLAKQDEMLRRGITMPMTALPVNDQSEPIPVFEWDVVNQSKGGLRVRRLGRTEQPIAVGEVAGIKLPGSAHWAIGVVRWVTVFEDGGMEFGLQYLAPVARAVTVSAWGAPSGPGLVLGGDGPTTLLTSPNAFSHLREIELDDRGDTVVVKPAELLEVTARYELFTIKTD